MARGKGKRRIPGPGREPEFKSKAQNTIKMINSTSDLIKALTTLTGALVTIVTISTLAWVVFRSELSTANITGLIKQYCLK